MPSVLNQILNQPGPSRGPSPDVLAMAAAAAAVAQAKTELKKDVCICYFYSRFSYRLGILRELTFFPLFILYFI
jgi:hypothetical protein